MPRIKELFLLDIVVAIYKINETIKGFNSANDLKHHYMAWDSVIREFEIIGEATKNLINSELLDNSKREIVDFRNDDNIEESYINIEPRFYIFVKFENVPDNIYDDFDYHKTIDRCRVFSEEEIEYSSKDKEDLESILKSRKYNL